MLAVQNLSVWKTWLRVLNQLNKIAVGIAININPSIYSAWFIQVFWRCDLALAALATKIFKYYIMLLLRLRHIYWLIHFKVWNSYKCMERLFLLTERCYKNDKNPSCTGLFLINLPKFYFRKLAMKTGLSQFFELVAIWRNIYLTNQATHHWDAIT